MPQTQESYAELLIPKPKHRAENRLMVFLALALLLHGVFYWWVSKYGKTISQKSALIFNVNVIKEIQPPKPKPKPLPPPPKPKSQPQQRPHPESAAPKLRLNQVKFHQNKTTTSNESSNLIAVGESKGGSAYGNPEGVSGGKGPISSTGTSKQAPPAPPPPPPPPRMAIPDRKLPEVLARCQPEYPETERDEGVQGTVQILVVVGREGQVLEVRVAQSSGNSDLDAAAVQNVKSCWKFGPAIQGGRPVQAQLTFPIVFQLQG